MKKTIILLSLLLLHWSTATAQDQLFKTDNTKILVKILEVGPEDIRYKLHENLNGPVYVESRKNVSLIIYQNGEHQVPNSNAKLKAEPNVQTSDNKVLVPELTTFDSLTYYRHSNCISLNFLYFFNNELGITYRREFFNSHFNIILPFAFGVSRPTVTQNVYFDKGPVRVILGNKVVEAGFGIHYYPSLKTNVNYYIGPIVRYMQYNCSQEAVTGFWGMPIAYNSTTLTRTAFSITNGLICRTKSRLTMNFYGSIGFKSDRVNDPLVDSQGNILETFNSAISLYWWSGFEVGFNF